MKFYTFLKAVISLLLLGLLFYSRRKDLSLTMEAIKTVDPALFLLCSAAFLLAAALLAERLKILLGAQGISLRLSETMYLTFIGYFFNNFLPTAIGGDVVKAYYAYKKTDRKLGSFATVFMDRFVGFICLFILASISILLSRKLIELPSLVWAPIVILFILSSVLFIFFNKNAARRLSPIFKRVNFFNLSGKLEKAYNYINSFRKKRSALLKAACVSFASQLFSFSVIYLFAMGMGSPMPIYRVYILMPLVCVISMFPSINGLGIREGAILFLFGPYMGYEKAFALSLLWLFMIFSAGVIGGISYAIKGGVRWQRS